MKPLVSGAEPEETLASPRSSGRYPTTLVGTERVRWTVVKLLPQRPERVGAALVLELVEGRVADEASALTRDLSRYLRYYNFDRAHTGRSPADECRARSSTVRTS